MNNLTVLPLNCSNHHDMINNKFLPYHYSDNENIYICNLCNCTYDSARSMKAHLWKHSGHHELNYPMSDDLANKNRSILFIQINN